MDGFWVGEETLGAVKDGAGLAEGQGYSSLRFQRGRAPSSEACHSPIIVQSLYFMLS